MFGRNSSAPIASPAIARDHAAVRHATAAREHIDQHRANGDPERILIESELSMLVEQADRMPREALSAIERPVGAGVDANVLPGEGQHHQRHQHVVLDRSARPSASCSASVRKSPIMS